MEATLLMASAYSCITNAMSFQHFIAKVDQRNETVSKNKTMLKRAIVSFRTHH